MRQRGAVSLVVLPGPASRHRQPPTHLQEALGDSPEVIVARAEVVLACAEAVLACAEAVLACAEAVLARAEAVLAPAEVVVAPAEVVVAPAEVVVARAEVVVARARVVVARAEAVLAPAEVVVAGAEATGALAFPRPPSRPRVDSLSRPIRSRRRRTPCPLPPSHVGHPRRLGQTAAERTLSQEGLQLCSRLRDAVRARAPKGHPALKAAGVGMKTSKRKTASVLACLEAITAPAAAYPEVFTAARVLADDLAECTRLHETLAAAQNAQQGGLLGAKDLIAAQ